jgi:hypothetical protein
MLRTDGPRERILVMGGWGAGKSQCSVDLATWIRKTNTKSRMFVIDTTYEADRNFQPFGESNGLLRTSTVESWPEYMGVVKAYRNEATPADWLVVDRGDVVWDQAQAGYSEAAFGKDIDQWFVEFRKEGGKGHAFSGEFGTHWGTIKRMYGAFMTEVMRWPGHVLMTAKVEGVQEPNRDGTGGDSKEVRAMFSKFGVRPGGEKNLGFLFHTVLWLNEPKQGTWVFTTVRDRGREQVSGATMVGFVPSYLVKIAGWKV